MSLLEQSPQLPHVDIDYEAGVKDYTERTNALMEKGANPIVIQASKDILDMTEQRAAEIAKAQLGVDKAIETKSES